MLCFMPVTVRIDGLRELLDQQFSVVSRGQLLVLGMEDHVMQWRIRARRPWRVLLPGVYLGLTGAPNLPQQEVAALLYAAPGSIITGPAALVHHGLRSPVVLETVDVLVPAGRHRQSTGFVRLHRTKRLPSRFVASGPLRLVPAARALADTTRLLSDVREVRAVVADAVQRGRCTVLELAAELRSGLQRPRLPIRTIPCPGSPASGPTPDRPRRSRDEIRSFRERPGPRTTAAPISPTRCSAAARGVRAWPGPTVSRRPDLPMSG